MGIKFMGLWNWIQVLNSSSESSIHYFYGYGKVTLFEPQIPHP